MSAARSPWIPPTWPTPSRPTRRPRRRPANPAKRKRRRMTRRLSRIPVQRGPKPESLAAETDGHLEVGTVDGAIGRLGLLLADVQHLEVPLPAIAGPNLDAADLVGKP